MSWNKQTNRILFTGKHLLVDISTAKFPNSIMLIDIPDYERLLDLGVGRIGATADGSSVSARFRLADKVFKVHKFLTPDWVVVDHVNGDRLDNRRANLREATAQQNAFNRKRLVNSKHRFVGVAPTVNGTYIARITVNRKIINLGTRATAEEAYELRKAAETEYFGEFNRKER